jgi:hypothetical protein
MKSGSVAAQFEITSDVKIVGDFLQTFHCDSCGNAGAVVSTNIGVALYCTHCVAEDNVKPRLALTPVRVEVRRG